MSFIIPLLSFYEWALEKFAPMAQPLSGDLLIQLIIGQCIAAAGMAIVFNQQASTGDNKAFITVHTMNEILGQNFKRLA
ncbi:YitT family protein [Cytobacillus firmus]|uniref:YitT family protein n=1 Tax=Cytobacillus firmus TaxID=1399 RepID=UPI0020C6883A|nr:YitT family protein [Cytobacillus firmus]MED1905708.1 YitT family protein [Cytobacillus firmus]